MDQQVSGFITRLVKDLIGAGADKKLAEMNAKVHNAFWGTLGVRLGRNAKELENEYRLKVQRGESAEGFTQESLVREGIVRKPDNTPVKAIELPEGSAPNFSGMKDFTVWVRDLLQEGGNITILSTGQTANFTNTNIKASTKRSRKQDHRDSYQALREMIKNSEYDHYEPADARHPNGEGQDVYFSALWMRGKLYSVKIKLDVVPENIKEQSRKYNLDTGDVKYKDHKLAEIEIAPTLYAGFAPEKSGSFRQPADASRVSLGILRENVNPSRIEDGVLYQQNEGSTRGIYTPGERAITLLNSADESTFVHESGHYFLDVLEDVAGKKDCPTEVKEKLQTVFDWFGIKDLNEWKSLSMDEKRTFHEQFARGFEQYLREGQAPSAKLKEVFDAFKKWLTSIYKSANELNVELNPEIREFYGWMLASDAERAEMRRQQTGEVKGQTQSVVGRVFDRVVDSLPVAEETKAAIRSTLNNSGIETTTQNVGENHPRYGTADENTFVDNRVEADLERDPDLYMADAEGNTVSAKEFLDAENARADEILRDANGVQEAALCMWREGAFNDID